MKPENIQAFKDLIEKYEGITLKEIQKCWDAKDTEEAAKYLTGFGTCMTCTLCRSVHECCTECVYFRKRKSDHLYCCNTGENAKTYDAINKAETPEELLKAFRKRAKHMRKAYSKYLI
jgi:hypothetical protein